MGKILDEVLKEFSRLVSERRFAEAEEFVVNKVEQGQLRKGREKLVAAFLKVGKELSGSGKSKEESLRKRLQRHAISLSLFNICMKINREKPLKKTIRNHVAQSHFNVGLTLFGLGKMKEAEASYKHAIRLKPDFEKAHSNLGVTLYFLGRLKESEASYKEAIKIDPSSPSAHGNLSITLFDMGRLEEAEATIRRAIEINQNFFVYHHNLGSILSEMGRLAEAEASYREATKINPDFVSAHNNLGAMLYETGRLEDAKTSIMRALEIEPEDPTLHNNLGTILYKMGRLEESETSLRKALEINSKEPKIHDNLGVLLFRTNRFDEARLHFGLAHKNYVAKGIEKDAARMEAFSFWMDGFRLWRAGNLTEAENSYVSACRLFRKAKREDLVSILTLLIKFFKMDKEYLSYLNSGNLTILKDGILNTSQNVNEALRKMRRIHAREKIHTSEVKVLHAKAACMTFLKKTLFFEPVKRNTVEEAKRFFSKYSFLEAYEGANAIDAFRIYLNYYAPNKNLNEISEAQEKELFAKLNPAKVLDGILTKQIAEKIVETLEPQLHLKVTKPIIDEEIKTRKTLTRKLHKIEEELESIYITLLGIEEEITVKRVAYGEYEILFPSPLGIYKIHIPAGEINLQDIMNAKRKVSNIVNQAIGKAKQTSTKLYNELRTRKQKITQKILTKLIKWGERKEGNGSI